MKNDWEPGGLLLEAWGELRAAVMQSVPSDDQIIMGHVRSALTLLNEARVRWNVTQPDYLTDAIANARAQAAGVENQVTREGLRESLDAAERVAR